jgi:uncharacterized protein YneF (UPF0154 family)
MILNVIIVLCLYLLLGVFSIHFSYNFLKKREFENPNLRESLASMLLKNKIPPTEENINRVIKKFLKNDPPLSQIFVWPLFLVAVLLGRRKDA